MNEFLVGIDGGGTGCRVVVTDVSGNVLGSGQGGPANIVTNLQGALINIRDAIKSAYDQAGLDANHHSRSHAFLGLAGANVAGASTELACALPFATTEVVSDGVIALQGALGDEDGVVVILGTGTAYIIRQNATVRFVGGWGFPLSDLGSGARLGQNLLQECLLVYDAIHPGSPLTTEILTQFDYRPENFVEFGRKAVPGDYAKFAPLVFDYAQRGDTTARMLLQRSADHVSETLDMLIAEGAQRISFLGGMSEYYLDFLPEHQKVLLVKPIGDALSGAIQLARKNYISRAKK